ncbi:MAG: hypothetical protein AAGA65_26180 [Actinomycetota bacterium]
MPSTHTHHAATRHREVTTDRCSHGPLPFAAKRPRLPWTGVALITLVCSAIAALPTWIITGDPTTTAGMGALLVSCCLALAVPAVLGHGNPVDRQLRRQRRHGCDQDDEDDSTAAETTELEVARLRAQLVELEQRGYRR